MSALFLFCYSFILLLQCFSGKILNQDIINLMQDPVSDDSLLEGQARLVGQMSVLPADVGYLSCHRFTATADPARSLFKPFIFCDGASIGDKTRRPSPHGDDGEDGSASLCSLHAHPPCKSHKKFVGYLEGGTSRAEWVLQNVKELDTNKTVLMISRNGCETAAPTRRLRGSPRSFSTWLALEMNIYRC